MVRRFMACLLVLLCAGPILADIVGEVQPPTVGFGYLSLPNGKEVTNLDLQRFQFNPGKNRWMLKGPFHQGLDGVEMDIEAFEFDPDPIVSLIIGFSNNTAAPQTVQFTLTLPTVFLAPNVISGAITTELMDRGADGATLEAPAGGAVYSAKIDGATVAMLQQDFFLMSASPSGSSAIQSASFGPQAGALPVTQDMGIDLSFKLSPGDAVKITSWFEIVPEPATLSVVLIGLPAMLRKRRS